MRHTLYISEQINLNCKLWPLELQLGGFLVLWVQFVVPMSLNRFDWVKKTESLFVRVRWRELAVCGWSAGAPDVHSDALVHSLLLHYKIDISCIFFIFKALRRVTGNTFTFLTGWGGGAFIVEHLQDVLLKMESHNFQCSNCNFYLFIYDFHVELNSGEIKSRMCHSCLD